MADIFLTNIRKRYPNVSKERKKIQVLYVSKLEKYSIVSLKLQSPKTCIITERILVKFIKEKEISLADTIGNITNHLFHNISNDYRKHKALRLKKRVE